MVEPDERELIGEAEAARMRPLQCVRARYQSGVPAAGAMMGDRAEGRTSAGEVFISLFKSIDGFRGDSAAVAWVYRVAAQSLPKPHQVCGVGGAVSMTEGYEGRARRQRLAAFGKSEAPDPLDGGATDRAHAAGGCWRWPKARELVVLRESSTELHEIWRSPGCRRHRQEPLLAPAPDCASTSAARAREER